LKSLQFREKPQVLSSAGSLLGPDQTLQCQDLTGNSEKIELLRKCQRLLVSAQAGDLAENVNVAKISGEGKIQT
jgi:hypothetical protein